MNDKVYTSLIAPVVTEKSTQMNAAGKYVFQVDPRATKKNVKDAIQKAYGVEVSKVNILKNPAKTRWGRGRKEVTKRSQTVRAIVTLKGDKTLDVNAIK